MTIPIINTELLFGSGTFASGTSATNVPNSLVFQSNVAYCRGPENYIFSYSSSAESNPAPFPLSQIVTSSLQSMNYVWQAMMNINNGTVSLYRTTSPTSSFTGWTFMGSQSVPYLTNTTQINNIDFAFNNYGIFVLGIEVPRVVSQLTNDHTTDLVIISNMPTYATITDTAIGNLSSTGPYDIQSSFSNNDLLAIDTSNNVIEGYPYNINYNNYGLDGFSSITSSLINNVWIIPNAKNIKILWDGLT